MSSETTPMPQTAAEEATTGDATERNRAACRRWIAAFNARDEAGEADARAEGYVAFAPASIQPEPLDGDAWEAFLDVFVQGFPDLQIEILGVAADEEMVAQRVRFRGTHTGDFRGLPPTGRPIDVGGIEMNRMQDGRVVEHWFHMDAVSLFEQLGLKVVPGPRLLPKLLTAPLARRLRRKDASA